MSEVLKSWGAHVFEAMNGEVIWTSGKTIASVFNSLRNNIRGAAGYRIIKWKVMSCTVCSFYNGLFFRKG